MAALINNRYRIVSILGSGGSSKTYLAEDTHLPSNRRCVIKQLRPPSDDPATYPIIKERFHREAVILEALGKSSEQIPNLQAYFAEGQEFYLVQDWIDGESLGQRVKAHGPFIETQVMSFLFKILPVLDYVHSQGIVHRDIKPENLMLRTPDDLPILIDFGAVKEVVTDDPSTIIIGSPGFMPPEQAHGKPVFSSDLYSLGFTAAYLLSGKRPKDLSDVLGENFLTKPPFNNISPVLAAVISKSTQLLVHERYQSAREMLAALYGIDEPTIIDDDATVVRPEPVDDEASKVRAARSSNSRGRLFLYGLIVALGLILAGALALLYARQKTVVPSANTRIEEPQTTGEYEITRTNDAYTSVRAAPRTSSPELGRLTPETRIVCETTVVKGETLWANNEWRYCPSVGGYVHSTLLRPAQH